MATTLDEFKQNIRYMLGEPVIQIDLAPAQFDLAINEAITFYQRNHFDGSEQIYFPVVVDSDLQTNRYIDLPSDIISVKSMFTLGSSSTAILSTDFILTADAVWQSFRSGGLVSYFNLMTYRSLIEELTVGKVPLRFNYNSGRLYIDMSSGKFVEGNYLMLNCVKAIDPTTNDRMWNDPWLIDYATAKVKKVWGQTLKKFSGVSLPGGIQLDGQTLFQEGKDEIDKLETEIIANFQLPVEFFVG